MKIIHEYRGSMIGVRSEPLSVCSAISVRENETLLRTSLNGITNYHKPNTCTLVSKLGTAQITWAGFGVTANEVGIESRRLDSISSFSERDRLDIHDLCIDTDATSHKMQWASNILTRPINR
ncbi:hypothetical protein KCU89_g38, partial [Aureobasidium melanogenum]